VNRTRVLAQGLADPKHIGEAFQKFVAAVFPFQKQVQKDTDKKMIEAMKKEVAAGVLYFKPIETNVFQQRANLMRAPHELRQRLADSTMKARRKRLG
jgi:hypothetical protein